MGRQRARVGCGDSPPVLDTTALVAWAGRGWQCVERWDPAGARGKMISA